MGWVLVDLRCVQGWWLVVVLTVMACGHDGVVGGSRIYLLGYFGL